jgi:hypothetical protein
MFGGWWDNWIGLKVVTAVAAFFDYGKILAERDSLVFNL